jgi:DNA-binding response OmpR family regulator
MNPPKVLIADADEVYRRQLRDFIIEKNDFDVIDVGSGEAAVNVAIKMLPSVVLLEIVLPDISGIEVCRKLKSDKKLKSIPVIIHTAKTGLNDRLSAYVVGAYKYLAKPCKLDLIYNSLLGALQPYENQKT